MLKSITFTGVDSRTDLDRLSTITSKYDIEFGVLVSLIRSGTYPRYPSITTITNLFRHNLNLSCHFCGALAYDFGSGAGNTFRKYISDHIKEPCFKRFQFNISRCEIDDGLLRRNIDDFSAYLCRLSGDDIDKCRKSIILQVGSAGFHKSYYDIGTSFLFDVSGGKGIVPSTYPISVGECGYAGGISPDNVKRLLPKILEAAGLYDTWIDIESGVRDESDHFDLDLVETLLKNLQ